MLGLGPPLEGGRRPRRHPAILPALPQRGIAGAVAPGAPGGREGEAEWAPATPSAGGLVARRPEAFPPRAPSGIGAPAVRYHSNRRATSGDYFDRH